MQKLNTFVYRYMCTLLVCSCTLSPSLNMQLHVWDTVGTPVKSNKSFPVCIRPVSEMTYGTINCKIFCRLFDMPLLSTLFFAVGRCFAVVSDQYLVEFLEDGGVLTLLDILSHTQSKEEDKVEALRLLLTLSNAGRKFKEMICESHGIYFIHTSIFYIIFGSL